MLKQSLQIISYLLISLLIGIIVTLMTDQVENVAVEKRIRTGLEDSIRHAIASFRESTARVSSADEKTFVKKYIATVMKDKVTVSERASGAGPDAPENPLFLFSFDGAA